MEAVSLLLVLFAIVGVVGLIYLIIALIMRKKPILEGRELLSQTLKSCNHNCKGCGMDCDRVIDQIMEGEVQIDDCIKLDKETKEELKNALDITPTADSDKIAFIGCRGGDRAIQNYHYEGAMSCKYINELYDGPKMCKAACIGCMDCAVVCPTNAIKKTKNGIAEVDRSLCIGCGLCTKVCPDNIIQMIPTSQQIAIACNVQSKHFGGKVSDMCIVGCTLCNKCVEACPTKALHITEKGLAYDNSKCTKCFACIYACPNGTITRLNTDLSAEDKKTEDATKK